MKPPATKKTKKKNKPAVPAQRRSAQIAQSRDGNIAPSHDGGTANERDEMNIKADLVDADIPPRYRDEVISENESLEGNCDNSAPLVLEGAGDTKSRESLFGSFRRNRKQKTVAASAGTVSNFLSKDYVSPCAKKEGRKIGGANWKGNTRVLLSNEEAEEFLFSMLRSESEINMGVVRDVLCHCGYDVDKALDTLLELSASSCDADSECGSSSQTDSQDTGFLYEESFNDITNSIVRKCQLNERDVSFLSEEELHEILQSAQRVSREVSSAKSGTGISDLQQTVLESLYSIPKSSEHKPSSMDWKNVVTKIDSIGQPWKLNGVVEPMKTTDFEKGNEYQVLREAANLHRDTMKSYYEKAAVAYSRGNRHHAAYLSEQARLYSKKAHGADDKASQEIFEVRNQGIQNTVIIDLHGQHVKQAIKLLKLHVILCAHLPSIRSIKVITGCGTHGAGKGKLKQSVISLLEKEGIEWREENIGSLVIKLDGRTDFSFVDSDSDS
ncbi:SMR domain-containing protein At5g58720 [Aristolochia californica]|uniref:SMR domain-containing protein At5g58720 n=1 Tax=Aristolochia californica TaxID=171875 RepID=UPI0035D8C38C